VHNWPLLGFAAALLLGSALVAAYLQEAWEYPIIRGLNVYAQRSVLLDRVMNSLTSRYVLQGVPFIALIWFLWFETEDPTIRARLLVGTGAASLAGVVSRLLQIVLPTHLRPVHEPMLHFVPPFSVAPDSLNHFSAFPSDHGAVFFTLCVVIWRVRPGFGAAAFAWALIVDLARVYEGYHFPSDLAGSIALGLAILCLFQNAHTWGICRRIVGYERSARPWFYMFAFLITFQIATLFDDIRQMGSGLASIVLHHHGSGGG